MKDYDIAYGKTSTIICGGGGGSDNMSVSDSGTKDMKIAKLQQQIEALRILVNQQAEDEGLWFDAKLAPEAYLQQALRKLHTVIEGKGY